MKMPTLHDGQIKFHAATQPTGQVVATTYPPDNKIEKNEQVLRLKVGARRQFPWWISIRQPQWRLSSFGKRPESRA